MPSASQRTEGTVQGIEGGATQAPSSLQFPWWPQWGSTEVPRRSTPLTVMGDGIRALVLGVLREGVSMSRGLELDRGPLARLTLPGL